MAPSASPSSSMRRSQSSVAASRHDSITNITNTNNEYDIPIDTLVNHLLVAKRSLSSMTLVVRANEVVNAARTAHEDASILTAQAAFLRSSTLDQAAILTRVRNGLLMTYEWGKKDFKKIVKAMDAADEELEGTMDMLRRTDVQSVFRQKGEDDRRNLLDFVDEASVHAMRDAMKKSIEAMQGIQQSYDGDLLRFDTDIRNLNKIIQEAPPPFSEHDRKLNSIPTMSDLLGSMNDHSGNMAHLLSSLTTHFDMCVTAIRTTEGAVALARRKAAEATQIQGDNGVSISGVIAEQESNVSEDLEPKTSADRAEMLRVVINDAEEVEDVVQEIQERLGAIEQTYGVLEEQANEAKKAYDGILEAYAILVEIGDRLGDYLAAEEDFKTRWEMEHEAVDVKILEMREMRNFYEGYASAYGSLMLEVERRRAVNDRVRSIWRKAQESVDKILDSDADARDIFRQDVGEFLPTDLWAGMQGSAKRWAVVPIREDGEIDLGGSQEEEDATASKMSVIEATKPRSGTFTGDGK